MKRSRTETVEEVEFNVVNMRKIQERLDELEKSKIKLEALEMSHKNLKKSHETLGKSHEELRGDFRIVQAHRARILAAQVLQTYLGEQPKRTSQCNFFKDLKRSRRVRVMVRTAFREARSDAQIDSLLADFDHLINGRNNSAHPIIDNASSEEIVDLVRYLEREDGRALLTVGEFTSLKVLRAQTAILSCRGFAMGSTHAVRVDADNY